LLPGAEANRTFFIMKRLRNLLLSLIIGFLFSMPVSELHAAGPGTTAHIEDAIALRAEPKLTASVIATLAVGVWVRVNYSARVGEMYPRKA
jgi:hypothetical protein